LCGAQSGTAFAAKPKFRAREIILKRKTGLAGTVRIRAGGAGSGVDSMRPTYARSDGDGAGAPAASDETDQALLDAILRGEKRAMNALFARHKVRVYRFILRMTKSPALAEDLISEVFLEVWRRAGTFEGRARVSTWILSIARFKALGALRQLPREELNDEVMAQIEDPADDPETRLEKNDRAGRLRACLTRLSPEHRELIDLVYYHEKSIAEVSEIVGIPQGTVKTRMFAARKKLAQFLSETEVQPAAMRRAQMDVEALAAG
jgi:RNA polymerase sigma-70 factor (ECF subfamily)